MIRHEVNGFRTWVPPENRPVHYPGYQHLFTDGVKSLEWIDHSPAVTDEMRQRVREFFGEEFTA